MENMSRSKKVSESQTEADVSSDTPHADVIFQYISTRHPAGVSLANLKESPIKYPMRGYPNNVLSRGQVDIALKSLVKKGRLKKENLKSVPFLYVVAATRPAAPAAARSNTRKRKYVSEEAADVIYNRICYYCTER
jgi:hypothetical protein